MGDSEILFGKIPPIGGIGLQKCHAWLFGRATFQAAVQAGTARIAPALKRKDRARFAGRGPEAKYCNGCCSGSEFSMQRSGPNSAGVLALKKERPRPVARARSKSVIFARSTISRSGLCLR